MSVSILEVLQNANYNLKNGGFAIEIAKEQLQNAVTLLERGYCLDEEVEPLIEKYNGLGNVPYNT